MKATPRLIALVVEDYGGIHSCDKHGQIKQELIAMGVTFDEEIPTPTPVQVWEHLRASADRQRERIKIEAETLSHARMFEMQMQLGQSELMLDLHDRLKKLEDPCAG